MYKRPIAFICSPKINTTIHINKTIEYSRTIFEHGYTPVSANVIFNNFIDSKKAEEQAELNVMKNVLIRKSFIVFVCGDYITDEMKQEMLYARKVGVTVVPLDAITRVSEYLEEGA